MKIAALQMVSTPDVDRNLDAAAALLARAAAAGALADADLDAFRRGVMEIVERQVAHIQKETMALLPLLDDLLDDDTDRELSMAYAAA